MNALEITNCPTMEVLAAIVEGHDGKTEQILRLNGTAFEVRLSSVGSLKRSRAHASISHANLERERSRVAKELRKNKLPKKPVNYGPVPVMEWAECTTLCDGQGYYRPESDSFVGPLRRVFDRRGTGKEAHANALRLSTSDYWQK